MRAIILGLVTAGAALLMGCETTDPARSPAQKAAAVTERKTVEFVERSENDMREHMAQWNADGWKVLSVSARLPQPDGTVLRRAELSRASSRPEAASDGAVGYDDRRIAQIKRERTTEAQLLEWFGPPESRDVRPDGRAHLTWSFASPPDSPNGHSGALTVSLRPDGKVEAYSARRGGR